MMKKLKLDDKGLNRDDMAQFAVWDPTLKFWYTTDHRILAVYNLIVPIQKNLWFVKKIQAMFDEIKSGYSVRSIETFQATINRWAVWMEKNPDVETIDEDVISRFFREMNYSPTTSEQKAILFNRFRRTLSGKTSET